MGDEKELPVNMGADDGRLDAQMDERRFDKQETLSRQMRMGWKPNPLIKHFENDPVVMELKLNNKERFARTTYQTCAEYAEMFACPCFWPHLVIVGTCSCAPCDYCFYAEERLNKNADAHKLVLRERSIRYVVESHQQGPICQPMCCKMCGGAGEEFDRFEEVYPISMVSWVGVVPGVKVCGGSGPDTFVVKVNDGALPSVVIDGPANELEKTKALISDTLTGGVPGTDLPPAVLQEFLQYQNSAPSPSSVNLAATTTMAVPNNKMNRSSRSILLP